MEFGLGVKNKTRLDRLEKIFNPRPIENYIIISTPEIEASKKCIQYNGKWITPEEYKKLNIQDDRTIEVFFV